MFEQAFDDIKTLSEEGLQINIWPVEKGFQVNVKEKIGGGWICVTNADLLFALTTALKQRVSSMASIRSVKPVKSKSVDVMDLVG